MTRLAATALLLLAAASGPRILVVPEPDMSGLEASVREQLEAAQNLAESLAEGDPADIASLAEAYGTAGQLYHAYDFRDAAEACYRNAASLDPAEFRWPYLLGVLLRTRGELEGAESSLRTAIELSPTAAAHYHLSLTLRELNRLDEAELATFESLSRGGGSAARAALGEIAMLRGDFDAAIGHFEAALEATPAANRLHYLLGMAYRSSGDRERATAHLAKSGPIGVTIADPLVAELEALQQGERIHILRGRAAFRVGRYDEAAQAFRDAVAAEPASYTAHVNLATTLGAMGDLDAAIATYRRALELSPEGDAAHFNLGFLLSRRGLHHEAVTHLEAAVEAMPRDAEVHRELARALAATGNPERALTHYARSYDLGGSSSEDSVLEAVQLLINLGRHPEALEMLQSSLERDPAQGRTTAALARFLAGSPDHALRDGGKALELASQVFTASQLPTHARTVAMAYAQLGRCAEAAEWQEKAIAAWGQGAELLSPELERYRAGPPCEPP